MNMTLIMNFNIGETLLQDRRKSCHWAYTILFIKMFEQNETKYQEQSGHTMKQENFSDTILG